MYEVWVNTFKAHFETHYHWERTDWARIRWMNDSLGLYIIRHRLGQILPPITAPILTVTDTLARIDATGDRSAGDMKTLVKYLRYSNVSIGKTWSGKSHKPFKSRDKLNEIIKKFIAYNIQPFTLSNGFVVGTGITELPAIQTLLPETAPTLPDYPQNVLVATPKDKDGNTLIVDQITGDITNSSNPNGRPANPVIFDMAPYPMGTMEDGITAEDFSPLDKWDDKDLPW